MKSCLFLLIAVLCSPIAGISQVAGTVSNGWTNVFTADLNVAFGPSTTATWDPSVGCRIQITDHLRVGVGDLSYGTADLLSGTRHAIMLGPVVEYLIPVSENQSYSILAGIPIQDRWGASITHAFGVAPYGMGSFEYHFSLTIALAGTLKVQYIATEAYLRTPRVLPSSAFVAALGIGFHYFFSL
jgi:hypothetical protein